MSTIVQVILERADSSGGTVVHWFLKHREGWGLHFNDQFIGATSAISKLRDRLNFSVPEDINIGDSGSEGTIAWQLAESPTKPSTRRAKTYARDGGP
jgi:hypothetical protein